MEEQGDVVINGWKLAFYQILHKNLFVTKIQGCQVVNLAPNISLKKIAFNLSANFTQYSVCLESLGKFCIVTWLYKIGQDFLDIL